MWSGAPKVRVFKTPARLREMLKILKKARMRDAIVQIRLLLVLGVAAAFAVPVLAQQSVLMFPNVACRAVPSATADVLGVFRHMGGEEGMFVTPARRDTSDAGDVWVYLSEGYTKYAGVSNGCWIPESVLARTDGYYELSETHLLQMADSVLSRPESISISDLVAVHNLLGHRRHRTVVEGSPAIALRRRQVLERAVLEAPRQGLAAESPLLIAWMESLPDQMHDASGGLEPTDRAIIAHDVVCRPAPAKLPVANGPVLPLDYHFNTGRTDTVVARATWTFVFDGCWVSKSLTAPGDTDEHVLAIAEQFKATGQGWSEMNLLRTYNVLSSRTRGHRDMVEASPILGLWRFEVLDRWLSGIYRRHADPLVYAIVQSLGEDVRYFEPGGRWEVRDEAFLNLHEQYKEHPGAHEILWTYVNRGISHDCEGDFACTAHVRVMDRWAWYWIHYPQGPRVADAVSEALDVLEYFMDLCRAARNAPPGSWEARGRRNIAWEHGGAEVASDLRASLTEVEGATKAPLLNALSELEACVAETREPQR